MNTQRLDQGLATTARCLAGTTGLAAALATGLALAGTQTYTLNAHFDLGVLSGVNHTVADQLQLNAVGQTTFPVLWIANAGDDTVTKFDSALNKEVARYRTWFNPGTTSGYSHQNSPWTGPAPSRTAVDLNGDAYVLNRHFEGRRPLLMKILANGFVDRNGNGVVDSSSDVNNNGGIDGAELFDLLDSNSNGLIDSNEIRDERIGWAVNVGAGGSIGRSLCLAPDGLSLWVGTYNDRMYYQVSTVNGALISSAVSVSWTPYGCVVDSTGNLWSASLSAVLGKINTGTHAVSAYGHGGVNGSSNYVVTLGNGRVYMAMIDNAGTFIKFDPATNAFSPGLASGQPGFSATGVAVDGAGNIIAGYYYGGGINKYTAAGVLICSAPTQVYSETRGIIVDQDGNYWQVNLANNSLSKYRADCTPLGVFPVGNRPYTYSDASGFAARNLSSQTGTWTVTKDGGLNGARWSNINWTESLPADTSIQVGVRSADNEASLPGLPFSPVSSGTEFTASGRYLQVQARLNSKNTGNMFTTPVLYDLTLASKTCDVDGDGDVDRNDISLITAARNTLAGGFAEPRDANGDGRIDLVDSRTCTLRCTRALCAP